MAIRTLMTITIFLVVDIKAFRPTTSLGRISSASPLPQKQNIQHLASSSAAYTAVARPNVGHTLSFKSTDEDDLVPNHNNTPSNHGNDDINDNDKKVNELLTLLDSVPSNLPTSRSLTDRILDAVKQLEQDCPTSDGNVLSELSGNWELLWTAQDQSSEQYLKGGFNRIINPLENQSYSNNPFRGTNPFLFGEADESGAGGRANPVLPRELQDVLERTGVLEVSGGTKLAPIRSSQGIDIRRKRVRNVVNVQIKKPFSVKASLIVDVDFRPNAEDQRRVDVKFDSFRIIFQNANVDRKFNLGVFGPRGWLRTGYIDDRIRITRGHKGSVFILSRTARRRSV